MIIDGFEIVRSKGANESHGGSTCHRHTNHGLERSMNDGAMSVELKKMGTIQEHEEIDEEGHKMG